MEHEICPYNKYGDQSLAAVAVQNPGRPCFDTTSSYDCNISPNIFKYSSYLCYIMLRGSELELLEVLQEELSVTEVAEQLDRSSSYTSELVARTEEQGLVRTRRDGRVKLVSPAESKAVELFQQLTQMYPHIDFADLLTGKTITYLYFLDEPISVAELAERTGDYRNTVNRVITRLLHRGIVQKQNSQYQLNDDFQLLHEFAVEYVHHLHRRTVSEETTTFTILWESLREFLVQTDQSIEADRFLQTGPGRFQEYGLPLLTTTHHHYFYTERRSELTVADVICHTLLIDTGSRYQTYCLLLIAAEDPDFEQLQETAEIYDIDEIVDDLLTYLDTRGEEKTASLPEWTEFESTADEYEVVL